MLKKILLVFQASHPSTVNKNEKIFNILITDDDGRDKQQQQQQQIRPVHVQYVCLHPDHLSLFIFGE